MIIVKLIVLYIFAAIFHLNCANYCEICRDHTLCLYSVPGPSDVCKDYDYEALLKINELDEIVNRINERRNFVAMGLSKFLPQAANMKKIVWSPELASSAQRWVDQCDLAIHPDKEDLCRDLVDTKVSQNIATILGSSPGLSVKSFVEMWFIQTLEYKGSVAYYNETQDHNTNYFTQLIWADTETVGCGKAKFYVAETNIMAERLVCNFAPSGNINGKPVYTIGYPGTQCSNNMIPDITYPGLCYNQNENVRKFTTQRTPVSSLLRILNLSNNSAKQEIDPIGNNFKQINFNSNKTKDQRNQKTRHVYFNNTYGNMKRVPSKQLHSFWNSPTNMSHKNNYHERGHSRVYHGYESPRNNHDSIHEGHSIENPWKYDQTTEPITSYSNNEFRKYNRNQQCTRKAVPVNSACASSECTTDICTRGQKTNNCRQPISLCESHTLRKVLCTNTNEKQCLCDKPTTLCPSISTRCSCNTNCQCVNISCTTPRCPNMLRIKENENKDEKRKSNDVHYYDLPPNLAIRSGDEKSAFITSSLNSSLENTRHFEQSLKQVKDLFGYPKLTHQDRDYLYGSFDSSERKRRELGDQISLKPFWQMDEYNYKLPSELKSIKYTTLSHKKDRKTRRTILSVKPIIVTESITMKLREGSSNKNHRAHITEKYLSFDELMHLRRLNTENADKEARRKAGDENYLRQETPTTTKTTITTTSEYTTNTPFARKKHCTRKLTCTWTAFTVTGIDGKVIMPGGGAIDHGSRTPPGYVEGCSRTSTCTREFMDRNKFASISDESSTISTPEDEDYCERRSLNLQRRNSEANTGTELDFGYQESFTDIPTSTVSTIKLIHPTVRILSQDITVLNEQNSCACYDETSRKKREENNNEDHYNINHKPFNEAIKNSVSKQSLSYGELYTTVLQKKFNSWEYNKISYRSSRCSCSGAFTAPICKYLICLIIFYLIYN